MEFIIGDYGFRGRIRGLLVVVFALAFASVAAAPPHPGYPALRL